MSALSDFFGDGSLLDKLQQHPQWTTTSSRPSGEMDAAKLIETAPLDAMRECAAGFEQWYDEYRIGWDAGAIAEVRAWVAQVVDLFNREGERLGG